MWTLKQLQEPNQPMALINGNWVPARPENYTKRYLNIRERAKIAWEVFQCRAEAFTWPEDQ